MCSLRLTLVLVIALALALGFQPTMYYVLGRRLGLSISFISSYIALRLANYAIALRLEVYLKDNIRM